MYSFTNYLFWITGIVDWIIIILILIFGGKYSIKINNPFKRGR